MCSLVPRLCLSHTRNYLMTFALAKVIAAMSVEPGDNASLCAHFHIGFKLFYDTYTCCAYIVCLPPSQSCLFNVYAIPLGFLGHFSLPSARMRSEGWVCLSVSVTLNLTCRMFVRLTNDTTYLAGNEGQKFQAVLSENAPLERFQHC